MASSVERIWDSSGWPTTVLAKRKDGDQFAKAQLIHADPDPREAGKARKDKEKIRNSPDARPRARS